MQSCQLLGVEVILSTFSATLTLSGMPERLRSSTQDPNIDGLLTILTPQAMSDPTETAKALTQYAKVSGKPMLASWMGGASVEAGEQILNNAGIPTFPYPDTTAQIFTAMWRLHDNLQALYETPTLSIGSTATPTDYNASRGDYPQRTRCRTDTAY